MDFGHKILVTSPEAKFLFPFLGLFGALGFGLGLGLGLVNKKLCVKDIGDKILR